MNRFLKWAFIVIGALVIVIYVSVQFFFGAMVKSGVNKYGPLITHTPVVLAAANVSPFSGAGTLRGLKVGNPPGWSDNPAFSLASVQLKMKPFSVFGDHIIINEIVVDGPEFDYETKVLTNNISDLLKSIQGDADAKGGTSAATKKGQPIRLEVQKFVLTNAKVRVAAMGAGVTIPMPDISLTDLGTKEGGITPEQLSSAIMKTVASNLVVAVGKSALKMVPAQAAADKAKEGLNALEGLLGGKKQ